MTEQQRIPVGYANYRGDQRHIVGEVKGPTTYGSVLIAIEADYDQVADRTRVRFAHATADDVRAAIGQ